MRIRTEVESWSLRIFLTVFGILFILYAIIYSIFGWLDDFENFLKWSTWVNVFLLPLMLAATFSYSARKTTLYINDYESIPEFKSALLKHILNKNLVVLSETEQGIVFKPTNWFYRLANSWGKTEYLNLQWGTEIIISGPSHRIQQIDDSLRWNKDFRN